MRLHTERQGAFMGMNIAEFKNLIHSFTDIMSEDVCESIRTSAGSMTMRFAKMLLGEVVSNDFAETNPKAYAELISLAFGALTEKAYNRTPNAAENYDLESRMLDIKSMDFRSMDCKVLYIRCPIILKQLNINDEVNDGIIAFGYLDYEAGLSFDVIGAARIYNNRMEISALDNSHRTKIRHGFFLNLPDVQVLNLFNTNADLEQFYQEVGMHELYYRDISIDIENMRMNSELDNSRHPSFPDDIQIHLVKDGRIVEAPWARCSHVDKVKGFMYARLLNEPHNEFGFHMNDEIPFRVIEAADGNLLCINLEHYNQ